VLTLLVHLSLIGLTIAAVIFIHYEFLNLLNRVTVRIQPTPRVRIVGGVGAAIIAHSLEVTVFAVAYYAFSELMHLGTLIGDLRGGFGDYLYFSFSVFTTVGFGDIVATGHLRWLVGVEALTGLVMITWTASFLYLEMARYWSQR
jgi:hypothetical protein